MASRISGKRQQREVDLFPCDGAVIVSIHHDHPSQAAIYPGKKTIAPMMARKVAAAIR